MYQSQQLPYLAINVFSKVTHGVRIKIGILICRPLLVFPHPFAVILEVEEHAGLTLKRTMLHIHVLILSLPNSKLLRPVPLNKAFVELKKLRYLKARQNSSLSSPTIWLKQNHVLGSLSQTVELPVSPILKQIL